MLGIRGARVLDPVSGRDEELNLLIEDGKIVSVDTVLDERDGIEILDAAGLVLAPGLVDIHVHFRDPGFTYKEDIESGARAAARGGFTTVVCMANTKPPVDNPETLRQVLEKGAGTGIHVKTCACVTKSGRIHGRRHSHYGRGAFTAGDGEGGEASCSGEPP